MISLGSLFSSEQRQREADLGEKRVVGRDFGERRKGKLQSEWNI